MSSAPAAAVIGAGLVGGAVALALADRGAPVSVFRFPRPGGASAAAAGMLAPSIDWEAGSLEAFARAARDLFPPYVASLEERTGQRIPLNTRGIFHVAATESEAETLRRQARPPYEWIEPHALATLEPTLAPLAGAMYAPGDGAVDNVALLAALDVALGRHPAVRLIDEEVVRLESARGMVHTTSGTHETEAIVLAAGAWSGRIAGARYAACVEPVRGQLVALAGSQLSHAVYGARCYLVPRSNCAVAGTTMERVGFDPRTTPEAIAAICVAARELCPRLDDGPPAAAWAGLRPLTPDLLPLLGRDPENPRLVYACGHSRNGVLLAPMTAKVLAELIFEDVLTFDLGRFRPDRFAGTFRLK